MHARPKGNLASIHEAYEPLLEAYPFLDGNTLRAVALVAIGYSIDETASILSILPASVRAHLKRARRMLGRPRVRFDRVLAEVIAAKQQSS